MKSLQNTPIRNRQLKKIRKATYQIKEGAWKLAYADFVTAMMCFFMLMWLLNTTPSQKLQSMAMYFKPTIGFFSNNLTNDVQSNTVRSETKDELMPLNAKGNMSLDTFKDIQTKLQAELINDAYIKERASSISTTVNGDGLEISIFDDNKHPMFEKESDRLTAEAKMIIKKITKVILYLPNRVAIGGYTEKMDNQSIEGNNGWDVSAGRASAAMKMMRISGLPQEKIAKLTAYGDNVPLDENDPYSAKNRRITITLLSKWSTVKYKSPISNSALSLDE